MLFNLKLKTAKSNIKFPSNSCAVYFCKDNNEFEELCKNQNLEISKPQIQLFTNEVNKELRIWDSKDPNLIVIKKAELNKKFNVDFFRNYLSSTDCALMKNFSLVVWILLIISVSRWMMIMSLIRRTRFMLVLAWC